MPAGELRLCLEEMCELTLFLAKNIEFPALERDYEFVSLCSDHEYPMNLGRIRSNKGLNVDQEEFGRVVEGGKSATPPRCTRSSAIAARIWSARWPA